MSRHFKALIGVGAVTLALVSASLAWAVVARPTKVLGGRGSQMLPAATPPQCMSPQLKLLRWSDRFRRTFPVLAHRIPC